jgi:CDP-glycerol glycerophosphotransferase (TagB/SpsB family)
MKNAITGGLPAKKIMVLRNPFFGYLRKWRYKKNKENLYRKKSIKKENKKIILYAPDPVSKVFKNIQPDEHKILQEIINTLDKLDKECVVLVKHHPKYNKYIRKPKRKKFSKVNVILLKKESEAIIYEIILTCDVVISMFSNILLEARCLGKRCISFFPWAHFVNPLSKKVSACKTWNSFYYQIKKYVY